MATSYLDLNGLEYLWGKVKERDAEDIDAGGVETTVVTGNPVEITSPYAQTAKDLTIEIEPVQDLHGYSKPWAGGTGKNKLNLLLSFIKQRNSGGTWDNDVYTYRGITYSFEIADDGDTIKSITANGTSSSVGNAYLVIEHRNNPDLSLINGETYIITNGTDQGTVSYFDGTTSHTDPVSYTFTYDQSLTQANWTLGVPANKTVSNLVFKPMIRLASETDASFEPYSNICPIEGLSSVGVERVRKNLLNNTNITSTINGVTFTKHDDGTVTVNGTASVQCTYPLGETKLTGSYIVNGCPSGGSSQTFCIQSQIDGAWAIIDKGSGANFNLSNQKLKPYIIIRKDYTVNNLVFRPMIRSASVADSTFEPYSPQSITISLGRDVYGGVVDVVNGTLTVDRVKVKLADQTLARRSTDTSNVYRFAFQPTLEIKRSVNLISAISNCLVGETAYKSYTSPRTEYCVTSDANGNYINVFASDLQTLEDWQAFATENDAEICYELATPQTYTLTPQQLSLLKGYNRVSTTGESLTLTYGGIKDSSVQEELFKLNKDNEEFKNVHSEIKDRIAKVYAFHIDGAVGDPAAKVTYLEDAKGMTPAHMDYTNGVFDYGSWDNAFFMPRPCMLSYDSKVDYYLDPNDYSKKEDGTASDIANTSYSGNAMMEWGQNGKKIWYKVVPDQADVTSGTVYISDTRIDDTYHAWSFINNQGFEVDHFYTPIYNGSSVNDGSADVMRSLSGLAVSQSLTGIEEKTRCLANNKSSDVLWYTEVVADRILIDFLLVLMGRSTDTQTVFGNGLITGSQTDLNNYQTGALNDKGLFFGYSDQTHGVKVFGMENYWGAQWRRTAGYILKDGDQRLKLTYGQQDGSIAEGYNDDGTGYLSMGITPTGTNGGYIDVMNFNEYGMFGKNSSGSSSTHYCDGQWFNNSGDRYALFGGASGNGVLCGAFCCSLDGPVSAAVWYYGVALSCKPKAKNLADNLAPTETSVAATDHAIGDYIMFDGQFCKVTGTIVAGDTITIGTNVVKTTLGAELLSILAKIS